jgi:hypothetical protein
MYKKHLIENLEREIVLLKELIPQIEEKDLQFRPAEKMRSTYEIMQYLSGVGAYMFRWMLKNDITPEVRQEVTEYRSTLTLANFSERMDEQLQSIKMYLSGVTEEDLIVRVVELPWKEKMPLGQAIMNCQVKWMASYRMQLFTYLKMNGNAGIGTKEAWVPKEVQLQNA